MQLNMDTLVLMFARAKKYKAPFIGVLIDMGMEKPEVIINEYENFDAKLDYYHKAYNEDLQLKNAPHIRIINIAYGNSYMDIQWELLS